MRATISDDERNKKWRLAQQRVTMSATTSDDKRNNKWRDDEPNN